MHCGRLVASPTTTCAPLSAGGFASAALHELVPVAAESGPLPPPKPAATAAVAAQPAIDVQGYVMDNIVRYDGSAAFLAPPTARTLKLHERIEVGGGRAGWGGGARAPGYMPRTSSIQCPVIMTCMNPNQV